MTKPPDDRVRAFIAQHGAEFIEELRDWLRIPSISADPFHDKDVRASAEWLAAALRRTGFPVVEVWETGGHPAVFAEWPSHAGESATKVLVYGHHDVQPVDPVSMWDAPPFEPVVKDGRLLGRGAADDKGQVYFHTLGVRAHLAASARQSPAVHLKMLVEGEEESGSTHFAELLRAHRERLGCDIVVVSDTSMWAADVPSTCTAMRGLAGAEITLRGPATDVHSGSFGGAIRNPLTELAALLAALHDDDGRVAVPGFYDGIVELTDEERQLFAKLPFDEAAWLANARSTAAYGEAGWSTLERVWSRPTAEINGLWGGYSGPGHKTIIPAEAHAKITFRLVAAQDPLSVLQRFREWVFARISPGVVADVELEPGVVRPCLTPLDHPTLQAVRRAMARSFESEVLVTREGGSGPEADLADILNAPVVFLGVSLPDDGWHGPNEKVEIEMLLKGAESAAYLWEDLSRLVGS